MRFYYTTARVGLCREFVLKYRKKKNPVVRKPLRMRRKPEELGNPKLLIKLRNGAGQAPKLPPSPPAESTIAPQWHL
jgi:hypothetical protein